MGRMGQESDFKTQLVLEICSISARTVVCVHRLLSKTPFVDWYHILGVEENAGTDAIRKRYHKLALQLHPDKNKHPKAEIAFKLVSEAHTCLCDGEKRKAFDLERLKNFCFECKRIPYKSGNATTGNSNGSSFKAWNFIRRSKSYKLWRNIKDTRERFKEEAKVIENCMRANSMSRRESPLYNRTEHLHRSKSQHRVDTEIPVFDPSDYLCQGYPHLRNQVYKNSETFWYLQTDNILGNERGRSRFHTPVFEVRSGRRMSMFTNKCAYVPS